MDVHARACWERTGEAADARRVIGSQISPPLQLHLSPLRATPVPDELGSGALLRRQRRQHGVLLGEEPGCLRRHGVALGRAVARLCPAGEEGKERKDLRGRDPCLPTPCY